ncbi:MAG: hypothetical protein IIZ08_08830 [Clostridia bacterium]|jgi:hypothetical protein|nr:hypothetical protein [Clostridia bacterium]MBQ1716443.1 hypothetical protein [Ruminococcus sp.]
MKNIITYLCLAIFCILFWNALRFIHLTITADTSSSFSVFNDVCLPAVIGVTVGLITNLKQKGR